MSRRVITTVVVMAGVVGVAALGYFFLWRLPEPSANEKAAAPTALSSARPSGTAVAPAQPAGAATAKAVDSRLTYRPAQARAVQQYTGPVDALGRPLYWWLYARSDQEVAWLNQYGYPSPAEEAQLRRSTEAELQSLAAQGDKNAKAHLAARSVKAAFDKQESARASTVQADVRALLVDGGPYQAATVLQAVGETYSAFAKVPEKDRTEDQRKIVNQYADLLPQALFIGEVYGDYSMNGIYNGYPAIVARRTLGIDDKRQPDAGSLASLISANARDRADRGDPPLTISARPRPAYGQETRFSNEPGAIILERK